MEYSFPHYLLAKQSVDDRALNRHVNETLAASLPEGPIRVVEVGAGIGSMLLRLLRWGLLKQADYTLVDEMPENIDYADVNGLSNAARQRLRDVRPETLGQAARIPGLTPAAVSLLLVHLKKRDRAA